jgi:hypothetical protein
MRGSVMISQDFADAPFDCIPDIFPLSRRGKSNSLQIVSCSIAGSSQLTLATPRRQ